MKNCTKCKLQLGYDNFHKDSDLKDGYRNVCKDCVKVYPSHQKENRLEYLGRNKDRTRATLKTYREKNKKSIVEYVTRYNIKNPEVGKAACAKYYKKNKEERNEQSKQYRKTNPGKFTAYKAARRAREVQATPKWLTVEQLKQIQSLYIEARKLQVNDGIIREVDHILPLKSDVVCGLHVPWNLQILTRAENNFKRCKVLL